ncbi:hypothetical protein AXX17_AT3G07180 [Arabidopsis thaliana]|uniref:Uncharacterized protein n=1 Tax=Arabidopsis thaliana TaxID=3702 RepID=A0A178VLZ0_ARATH|nr:hypothetical protein AXX17_AT3G07180 [Arabidopsis thaliana]
MHPPARPSAKAIGDGFAEHYYNNLQNSPEILPGYYKDVSKITRPGLDGTMRSSTLPDIIEDLDMLSPGGFDSVEVTSVMSQDSHDKGIRVAVDGYFTFNERPARNFTQNFTFAPQEKGLFVSTDMFKFVGIPEANATIPPANNAAICVKNLPLNATIALVENAFKQFGEIRRGGVEVRNKRSFSYGFVEFKEENAAQRAIKASPVTIDLRSVYVEKKRPDYIRYWDTPSTGPGIIYRSEGMSVTKDYGNKGGNENNQEPRALYAAVHVKNLPPNVTTDWVENAFKQFGPIKRGGVQVSNRGVVSVINCCRESSKCTCFGPGPYLYLLLCLLVGIHFDLLKPQVLLIMLPGMNLIQASPLLIGRRKLKVEKKLDQRVQNQN